MDPWPHGTMKAAITGLLKQTMLPVEAAGSLQSILTQRMSFKKNWLLPSLLLPGN